ncbi:hypothetical protein JCM10908_006790 [Rhodotorula pacifica]|uniref:uncharacterized protein n=1 Tax=Rhodotorula pacifica TaxID=1495444 RepID=UPI00317E8F5E
MLSACASLTQRLYALLFAAILGLLCFSPNANAQQLTTYTDTDAAVVTTTISQTLYTTEGQVFTFTASTPSTVTPLTFSTGSVMNAADYMRSKSLATAMPPERSQTASLRSGVPNFYAVDAASAGSRAASVSAIAAVGAAAAAAFGLLGAGAF